MKLLFICSQFYPDNSKESLFLTSLVKTLSQTTDIDVIAPKGDKSEIDELASVHRVGGKKSRIGAALGFNKMTAKLITQNEYDHIIASTWEIAGSAAFNISKRKNLDYSVILFDNEVRRFLGSSTLITKLNNILKPAKNIFVTTMFAGTLLKKLNLPKEKIVHLPPGMENLLVDNSNKPDKEETRKRLSLKGEPKIFLSIAPLEEEFGIDILVWAGYLLKNSFEDFRLLIFGEGSHKKKLDIIINDLKLNEHVIIKKDYSLINEAIFLSDVYVASGRDNKFKAIRGYDPYLLYAMNYKKPVISVTSGGLHEFVSEGKTGFLVPPLHPKDISDRLKELLTTKKKAASMGQKGYTQFSKIYNWAKSIETLRNNIKK